MNKERLISYRKFCVKHKYHYCIPEDYKFVWDSTNKEGEKALQLLKNLLVRMTHQLITQIILSTYIKKRKYKNEKL